MFIYFHQHKTSYDKGQIAPLMILVLVILIIMAMVTVNLYKVAMDKTNSANAVDAGSLAAGSVLANVFNAVASANAEMKKGYELAYYGFLAGVGLTVIDLLSAQFQAGTIISDGAQALSSSWEPSQAAQSAAQAFKDVGKCIEQMQRVKSELWSQLISITALYGTQLYFYGKLRETAREGCNSAREQGHKFLFYNSGLGSRLPEKIPEGSLWSVSRKDFSRWLDGIDSDKGKQAIFDTYSFGWVDGQGRRHAFVSSLNTQDLDAFYLIKTIMPFPALEALLISDLIMCETAGGLLLAAAIEFAWAQIFWDAAIPMKECCDECVYPPAVAAACGFWGIFTAVAVGDTIAAIAETSSALGLMVGIDINMSLICAGLYPDYGNPIRDDNMGFEASSSLICWIDDIDHNRRLRMDSMESQEGADLGLVNTEYPPVHSYSVIDFHGHGKMVPKESKDLSFDPSIIETDVIGNK